MKNMLINQAKNTGMYKERKYNPKHNVSNECEVLRKNVCY